MNIGYNEKGIHKSMKGVIEREVIATKKSLIANSLTVLWTV